MESYLREFPRVLHASVHVVRELSAGYPPPYRDLFRVGPYVGDASFVVDVRGLSAEQARRMDDAKIVAPPPPVTEEEFRAVFGEAGFARTLLRLGSGAVPPPPQPRATGAVWARAGVRIARLNDAAGPSQPRNARAVADVDADVLRGVLGLCDGEVTGHARGYLDPVYLLSAESPRSHSGAFAVVMPMATGLPPLGDDGAPADPPPRERTLHDPPPVPPVWVPSALPTPATDGEVFELTARVLRAHGAAEDVSRREPGAAWWFLPTRAGVIFLLVKAPHPFHPLWTVSWSPEEPPRVRRLLEDRWDATPELDFVSPRASVAAQLEARLRYYAVAPLERPPASILPEMIRRRGGDGGRYTVRAERGAWRVFDGMPPGARRGEAPVEMPGGTLSPDRARGRAATLNLSADLARFFRGR